MGGENRWIYTQTEIQRQVELFLKAMGISAFADLLSDIDELQCVTLCVCDDGGPVCAHICMFVCLRRCLVRGWI